ncbi:glycosyltransferase [Nitratidesulfovibrio termitidis]|uniref:glycosyltransferase n=1 Tax=Nitratidesulfovibrio termitidis TaxID=42252 RepID=UPI000410890E|nr:glycosyltransferase [Nitratidesulfovibrio termitidis]
MATGAPRSASRTAARQSATRSGQTQESAAINTSSGTSPSPSPSTSAAPSQSPPLSIDLHVHSRHSTRPSQWILQKLGCAESYTDPKALYDIARRRGMDLVTITDHNTLAGSLEIAHLDHTFVSEEITAYFPEDRCKIHVLAWDLTEAHHADITRLRENIYDLVDYLTVSGIPHACAHAMYSLNERLTLDHMERLLLLFRVFELNGSRDDFQNGILRAIVQGLTPADMDAMADRQDMTPRMERAWVKHLMAGSDDHSSLNIARSHTIIEGVSGVGHGRVRDALRGVMEGRGTPHGSAATPVTMAHNLYSIAYQFYKQRFGLARHVNRDTVLRFADRVLTGAPEPEGGLLTRLHGLIGYRRPRLSFSASTSRTVQDHLQTEAAEIIRRDPELRGLLDSPAADITGERTEQAWMRFADQASEKVLRTFADTLLDNAMGADLFSVFNVVGSAGSLYAILAPYFVGYTLFTKDRAFARACRDHFLPHEAEAALGTPGQAATMPGDRLHAAHAPHASNVTDPDEWHATGRLNVGHFTDTFYDVNGVARTLQMQLDIARRNDKRLQVITCAPEGVADPELADRSDVFTFSPIGSFAMPEYPGLALYYPPVLKMLDHCYRQGFTHLHSATPGPVGLVALAAARILRLPIHATYHTAFPQYVMMLTEDAGLEEAMWRYMIWYYNQMDRVYVPSHATGDELAERGIARERIAFYPRGIDTETFTPARRNGFFNRYDGNTVTLPRTFLNSEAARAAGPGRTTAHDAAQPVRFLYVGRLSREKNLHVLADAYRLVAARAPHLRLVLVGDGPARAELEETLRGLPVTFTGYLTGDDLANAYASSDIFVFPSGTDTFGNVVLEAQASGLPVVVTDKGGPQENLLPGRTGAIVPEGDATAMAQAMLDMAADPARLNTMRTDARAYAESRSFEAAFLQQWAMYRDRNAA